jgi:hypothetical protein
MKQITIDTLIDIKTLADDIIKELAYCNNDDTLWEIDQTVDSAKDRLESILKYSLELG